MKLIVNKSVLEITLMNFQAFLDKKDSSQITSHIYFESLDSKLLLRATDYEIGIEAKIDIIKKESEGNATVNGRIILDIVKKLEDGEIILETDNDFFYIKQGRTKYKESMFNAAEFPIFPKMTDYTKLNIDTSKFITSIKKINPAIETTNQKMELNGAFLDIKDYSYNFVATDTRRLAVVKYETQSVDNLSIIIPKKATIEILKLFYDEFEIYYNQSQIIIKTEQYMFFTKLINGKYPDYEKIIPKTFKNEIKLPKDIIEKSIKKVNLCSNIKITIKPKEIFFEAISDESSRTANTQIELDTQIQSDITIGANSKYILDFFSQIEDSEFLLCLNDSNNPFVLKDKNFSTIVMPIIF
ncbi:DNA polymerase III subunit beta [Helicobacter cappadocius]|uniref:Beta sliding clamp n=1 Tax=Helicobacter cappadocius TaxID=3063998 RepID=A0AA90TE91_9HELI|nr:MULTISPECIES: DNA polymerase III subunit beta [unclassified Helicobacter]MDO7252488.1 DNA polymerase III subunit beta [Helicobacter sp. faydin-H75]MDP2538355.1 DNA polymerase III subunit beta [Helicobacter sp. faydin-H76]